MQECRIVSLETRDVRFPLPPGAGTDAIHSDSEYSFTTTLAILGRTECLPKRLRRSLSRSGNSSRIG
jgi:hypothetical protein